MHQLQFCLSLLSFSFHRYRYSTTKTMSFFVRMHMFFPKCQSSVYKQIAKEQIPVGTVEAGIVSCSIVCAHNFFAIWTSFMWTVDRNAFFATLLSAFSIVLNWSAIWVLSLKCRWYKIPKEQQINEEYLYWRPYHRITPFLVGLLLGDVLYPR